MEREQRLEALQHVGSDKRFKHSDNYPRPQSFEVLNRETGELEVIEAVQYDPEKYRLTKIKQNYDKTASNFGRKYKIVFEQVSYLFQHGMIDFDEFSILVACVSCLEYESFYVVHPRTKERMSKRALAGYVGKNKNVVSRLVDSLAQKGLLVLEKHKNYKCIMVSCDVGFYGSSRKYHALIQKRKNEMYLKELKE